MVNLMCHLQVEAYIPELIDEEFDEHDLVMFVDWFWVLEVYFSEHTVTIFAAAYLISQIIKFL